METAAVKVTVKKATYPVNPATGRPESSSRADLMSDNDFKDLLKRWARYVFRENRANNGFSQVSYSEYVGAGAYGSSDPIDSYDPDVISWDSFYRSPDLPDILKRPIWRHFCEPRVVTEIERKRPGYSQRFKVIRETALGLWSHWEEGRRVTKIR